MKFFSWRVWFLGVFLGFSSLRLMAQAGAGLPFDVLLGRPTDRSIALSFLATTNLEVIVDYGTQSGLYPHQSAVFTLVAGTPYVATLSELQADTVYLYRVRYRPNGGANYSAGTEARFVTQRAPGKSFTFVIEADPHHLDNEPAVWQLALDNMLADKPDFMMDLGDTFMDEKYGLTTYAEIEQIRKDVRAGFFGRIGHSVPVMLVNGNHDPELGWLLNRTQPQANLATWGVQARQRYYPCPVPGPFYSGDTGIDNFTGGPRDAYYAFEWGDALMVALDPFWYSSQATTKSKDPWLWTLGKNQYDWLKRTLEQSRAKFKFVFLHHLVGGSHDTLARGGIEYAPYYEWGGKNLDDTNGFAAKRPGWAMPIQDLLLANKVNVVFHGHDHLYIKQDLDVNGDGTPELIYQEVPQPCRTNQNTTSAAPYGYRSGVMYPSSGHLRVTVTSNLATVEYVRTVAPTDTRAGVANRTISHRYTMTAASTATPSRLSNLSVRSAAGRGSETLIMGFIVGGGNPLPLLVRGVGPTLARFNVPGVVTDPLLTLSALGGADLASNDDWSTADSGGLISAASLQAGAFALPSGSADAALLAKLSAGAYTAQVTTKTASTGVALLETYDTATVAGAARLVNVSARTKVGTGADILIAGFVIAGEAPKQVLIRAVGPTLVNFGVGGVLADPKLAIFRQGSDLPLLENDNWDSSAADAVAISAATVRSGTFALPAGAKDAAALVTLSPGAYTAQVSGAGGSVGVALIEIYEVP